MGWFTSTPDPNKVLERVHRAIDEVIMAHDAKFKNSDWAKKLGGRKDDNGLVYSNNTISQLAKQIIEVRLHKDSICGPNLKKLIVTEKYAEALREKSLNDLEQDLIIKAIFGVKEQASDVEIG